MSKENIDTHINSSINAIEETLNVTITIHDHKGFFVTENGNPLIDDKYRKHSHKWCSKGRTCKSWDKKCLSHCLYGIYEKASKTKSAFVDSCWKGVSQVVVPIYFHDIFIGILFAGVFKTPENKFSKIPEWDKLPKIINHQALMKTLCIIAKGLVEHSIQPDIKTRKSQIQNYLHLHSQSKIELKSLAKHLHLSPSRTAHVVVEEFGLTFSQLLKGVRIEKAKTLLISSRLNCTEIASRVGFDNPYYFNRIFKQTTGIPPAKYRKLQKITH